MSILKRVKYNFTTTALLKTTLLVVIGAFLFNEAAGAGDVLRPRAFAQRPAPARKLFREIFNEDGLDFSVFKRLRRITTKGKGGRGHKTGSLMEAVPVVTDEDCLEGGRFYDMALKGGRIKYNGRYGPVVIRFKGIRRIFNEIKSLNAASEGMEVRVEGLDPNPMITARILREFGGGGYIAINRPFVSMIAYLIKNRYPMIQISEWQEEFRRGATSREPPRQSDLVTSIAYSTAIYLMRAYNEPRQNGLIPQFLRGERYGTINIAAMVYYWTLRAQTISTENLREFLETNWNLIDASRDKAAVKRIYCVETCLDIERQRDQLRISRRPGLCDLFSGEFIALSELHGFEDDYEEGTERRIFAAQLGKDKSESKPKAESGRGKRLRKAEEERAELDERRAEDRKRRATEELERKTERYLSGKYVDEAVENWLAGRWDPLGCLKVAQYRNDERVKKIGVSEATIAKWLSGEMAPSDANKRKMAQALGYDISFVISGITKDVLRKIPTTDPNDYTQRKVLGLRIDILMCEWNTNQTKLGVGREEIPAYRAGKAFPMSKRIRKFASVFGITPAEFLGVESLYEADLAIMDMKMDFQKVVGSVESIMDNLLRMKGALTECQEIADNAARLQNSDLADKAKKLAVKLSQMIEERRAKSEKRKAVSKARLPGPKEQTALESSVLRPVAARERRASIESADRALTSAHIIPRRELPDIQGVVFDALELEHHPGKILAPVIQRMEHRYDSLVGDLLKRSIQPMEGRKIIGVVQFPTAHLVRIALAPALAKLEAAKQIVRQARKIALDFTQDTRAARIQELPRPESREIQNLIYEGVLRPRAAGESRLDGMLGRPATLEVARMRARELANNIAGIYGIRIAGWILPHHNEAARSFFNAHIADQPVRVRSILLRYLVEDALASLDDDNFVYLDYGPNLGRISVISMLLDPRYLADHPVWISPKWYGKLCLLRERAPGELKNMLLEPLVVAATDKNIIANPGNRRMIRDMAEANYESMLEEALHMASLDEASVDKTRTKWAGFNAHIDARFVERIIKYINRRFNSHPLGNPVAAVMLASAGRYSRDQEARELVIRFIRSKVPFSVPSQPEDAEEACGMLFDDDKNLENFIAFASMLRLIYPEDMTDNDPRPPLRYARENGIVFELGPNLYMTPVSEGFRRHIIFALNADGAYKFRFEIMILGEAEDRSDIDIKTRKEVADSLRNRSKAYCPDVIYTRSCDKGPYDICAYGQMRSYSADSPLRIIAYEYRMDGKRLSHCLKPARSQIAWRYGITERELDEFIIKGAACLIAAAHADGWKGRVVGANDCNTHNIRLGLEDRLTLEYAGDFNAYDPLDINRQLSDQERDADIGGFVFEGRETGKFTAPPLINLVSMPDDEAWRLFNMKYAWFYSELSSSAAGINISHLLCMAAGYRRFETETRWDIAAFCVLRPAAAGDRLKVKNGDRLELETANSTSGTSAALFTAKTIVEKLELSRREFRDRFPDSETYVDVLFAILPISGQEAYFSAERFGKAEEHADLSVIHPAGAISGSELVRGDLMGPIEDESPHSYIILKPPRVNSHVYRRLKDIKRNGQDTMMRYAANDLILSAQLFINGGVPPTKRLILEKSDTLERILYGQYGHPISYFDTLGKLAVMPLLDPEEVAPMIRKSAAIIAESSVLRPRPYLETYNDQTGEDMEDDEKTMSENMLSSLNSAERAMLKRIIGMARKFRFQDIYVVFLAHKRSNMYVVTSGEEFPRDQDLMNLFIHLLYVKDLALFAEAVGDDALVDDAIKATLSHEFGHYTYIAWHDNHRADLMMLDARLLSAYVYHKISSQPFYERVSRENHLVKKWVVKRFTESVASRFGLPSDMIDRILKNINMYETAHREALLRVLSMRTRIFSEDADYSLCALITDDESLNGVYPGLDIEGDITHWNYDTVAQRNAAVCVLRPRAAGDRLELKTPNGTREKENANIEVAKKVVALFKRWDEVTQDELLRMGFSQNDIAGLRRLYQAVWPHTTPYYKYLTGGHIFMGEEANLFQRIRDNRFGAKKVLWGNYYHAGNKLDDAYYDGRFRDAARQNSDGYVAIYPADFFNNKVILGEASVNRDQGDFYLHVDELPVEPAERIIITDKGMRTVEAVCQSSRGDKEAEAIRRLFEEGKFIVTQGNEENDRSALSGIGIVDAMVEPTHENDVLWTLREPGMSALRLRVIEVLGKPVVGEPQTIRPDLASSSVLRPVAAGDRIK